MDKTIIEQLKKKLEKEQARLEKELANVTGGKDASDATVDAEFPDFGSKEDENAAEVASFSDNLSLEEKIEESLGDVEKALVSIAEGTYGTCKYCKNAIDIRRLEARPASSSCIHCKEAIKSS